MKKILNRQYYVYLFLSMMAMLSGVWAFAQDSASTVTTSTTTTQETTSIPTWVWVVGGAIILLIIIALLRGNRTGTDPTTDKVTYTKTTTTDRNT